jgi:hypothetical protein
VTTSPADLLREAVETITALTGAPNVPGLCDRIEEYLTTARRAAPEAAEPVATTDAFERGVAVSRGDIAELRAERDSNLRMFQAAVASLARISKALGIPDDEAMCANGDSEIIAKIAELRGDATCWRQVEAAAQIVHVDHGGGDCYIEVQVPFAYRGSQVPGLAGAVSALAAPHPAPTDSQAGRDAVEAFTGRQCLVLSFALRHGNEPEVLRAVDRFIEHGEKFAVEKCISEARAALAAAGRTPE